MIISKTRAGWAYLSFIVVLLPERAIFGLPTHVENCKVNLAFAECFYLKTYGRCNFHLCILCNFISKEVYLFGFEEIDHGGLARIVETDYDNLRFLLANGAAHY